MSVILITGGTGFIGSHTSLVLLKKGYYLYIIDSLENSSIDTLKRIKRIDQKYKNQFKFFRGDLRNKELLRNIFIKARESGKIISGIIHFAGLKSVSDSIENPIKYHFLSKRYLARHKRYYNKLSKASKISLKLQGGVLNDKECEDFENKDYFKSSILLRKFDEASKKVGIKMKNINQYKELLKLKLK